MFAEVIEVSRDEGRGGVNIRPINIGASLMGWDGELMREGRGEKIPFSFGRECETLGFTKNPINPKENKPNFSG